MAVFTTPSWIRYWLLLSSIVVVWDFMYCFMRPRSMPGGDLAWVWGPYNAVPYSDVDWVYGFEAFESGDGFTNAQATMNVLETFLNLVCLALGDSPAGPVVGLIAMVMTSSKTSLYILQDYFCGWCKTGHNSLALYIMFFGTNGLWVVVPAVGSIVLSAGIIGSLNRAALGKRAKAE